MPEVRRRFVVKLPCRDCGHVLNTSTPFNLEELRSAWMELCFSGPLNTPSCPNGCRSTFSDCNLNTSMQVCDADTGEVFDLRNRRLDELPAMREVA